MSTRPTGSPFGNWLATIPGKMKIDASRFWGLILRKGSSRPADSLDSNETESLRQLLGLQSIADVHAAAVDDKSVDYGGARVRIGLPRELPPPATAPTRFTKIDEHGNALED
jgi:hypothetical protein